MFNFGIPKGDKGDKGDQGERGEQGLQGAKGDTGERGPQGARGPQGIQGPQGPRGYAGADADPLDCWPVGSVYISYTSTSPSSRFGGSWTAITGRFPYFNAGTGTGGKNSISLSRSNLPAHTHSLSTSIMMYKGGSGNVGTYGDQMSSITSSQAKTGSAGSGSSFSIMPQYQTFYAWRRTG